MTTRDGCRIYPRWQKVQSKYFKSQAVYLNARTAFIGTVFVNECELNFKCQFAHYYNVQAIL